MENRRGTSIMVWLPDYEENVVVDAVELFVTGNSIYFSVIREGEEYLREYVTLPATYDIETFRLVAHRTSEDEQ